MADISSAKSVLITGATGYIGRRLTHRLLEAGKYRLRVLVRNRHKVQVALTDLIDIHEGKRLLLYAQMKLPGQAWLEFDIQPDQLVQTAHYLPRGVLGRLYWYAVLPFHHFVFADLARSVIKASRPSFEER